VNIDWYVKDRKGNIRVSSNFVKVKALFIDSVD